MPHAACAGRAAATGAGCHRRRRFLALLAATWLASGSATFAETPLLTERTHVVVLVGLPGDAETESTYTRQVERLLELLAHAHPRPRTTTVLADAPELVDVPEGLRAQVVDASRERLRSLASTLAAEELVVFAWGHGGLRGDDPVFHVRGPRIEPEDLAALGSRAPRSTWFLLFRQSAAFARRLRTAGATMVTSEADTSFRNDPIGTELLLDLLRDRPGTGPETLAHALGQATLVWYERARLARTEEPTLWLGESEPVRLSDAAPEELARVPAQATLERVGSAWDTIEPATPAEHPGAPAVVLRREVVHTIGAKPAVSSVIEEFVQVLTREGERYAQLDLSFSPPGEMLHVLDLERRSPDGSLERLDDDLLGDSHPSSAGEHGALAHRVGELPGAEPGAIFRLRYQREWMSFPLPHVYLEVPLAGPLPTESLSIEVRAAREGPFHFGFRNHARKEPETSDGRYGRSHRWRFENVDAVVPESLVAPTREPALLVSTFPDWEAFSAWFRRLIRMANEVTPEIAAAAEEIAAASSSPREKVQRLADFVTSLRYVAVPLGVNSHRPHAAANVLRNRYGDCKDKANLLNTMLAALGIEAQLVLVPRFTQADEATPGLAFNHAISRVRIGGEVLWVDTTDPTTRFGLLPPGDPGRKVLVIEEGAASLTMLPEPLARDHRLELSIEVPLEERSAGRIQARTTGYLDYRLRNAAQGLADLARNTPLLSVDHRPVAGQFSLAEQASSDASDLERPFAWSASGSWSGIVTEGPDGSRLLRAPFWLPAEWHEALHRRRTPLYLNDGYPFELDETLRFATAAGFDGRALPPPLSGQSDPLRWSVEWSREGDAAVARLRATLSRADLDRGETRAFQRELRRLLEALALGIRVDDVGGDPA